MSSFVVLFGERKKLVKYSVRHGETLYDAVSSAVLHTLISDPKLKNFASKPYFLRYFFSNGNGSANGLMEFDESTELLDIDTFYPLEFVLQDNFDETIATASSQPQLQSIATANSQLQRQSIVTVSSQPRPPLINNSNLPDTDVRAAETSYLNSIGFDTSVPSGTSNTANNSTVGEGSKENEVPDASKRNQKPKKRKAAVPIVNSDDDDESSPYMKNMLLQRQNNAAWLAVNNIPVASSSVPKVKKRSKTPANKKPTNREITRVMPTRKAKGKKSLQESSEENLDQPELQDDAEPIDNSAKQLETESLLTSSTPVKKPIERKPVLRWSQEKQPDLVGKAITKNVPLSPLPALLEKLIRKGVLDIRKVNSFLIMHCIKITSRYPIRGEYVILASQFCRKMDCLGVVNATSYETRVRTSLSSSVRAKKRYPTAIKPKRQAQRETNRTEVINMEMNEVAEKDLEERDSADSILRRPVLDKDSAKHAISSSTARLEYIQTHTINEIMLTYPYLHHCDLLIHDYATRIPSTLTKLQSNFHESLVPVACILDHEEPSNELQRVQLFQDIESFFEDVNDKDKEVAQAEICPALQLWDTSVKALHPLNNIPKGQAPAIVVLKADNDLTSVNLTFDGEKIATLTNPSAFDCISLLIGAYYVFNCHFPSAYMNLLQVIEAILHGTVDSALKSCGGNNLKLEFLQKLSTALVANKTS